MPDSLMTPDHPEEADRFAALYRQAGGEVSPPDAAWLAERAERIRLRGQRIAADIVAIGQDLLEVGERVDHRKWADWLNREFGWTDKTARRFMDTALAFPQLSAPGGLSHDVAIDAHALYLLSAPRISAQTRDEALRRAAEGERITVEQARYMVEEAMAQRDAADMERAAQEVRDREAAERAARDAWQIETENKLAALKQEFDAKIAENEATVEEAEAAVAELTMERDAAKPKLHELDPVDVVLEMLNRKRLTANQAKALALLLNRRIVIGEKAYDPITDEQRAAMEHRVTMTVRFVEALRAVGSYGTPGDVAAGLHPAMRAEAVRLAPEAAVWLQEFVSVTKE